MKITVIQVLNDEKFTVISAKPNFYEVLGISKQECLSVYNDKFLNMVKNKNSFLNYLKDNERLVFDVVLNMEMSIKLMAFKTGTYKDDFEIYQFVILDVTRIEEIEEINLQNQILNALTNQIVFEYELDYGVLNFAENQKQIFDNAVGEKLAFNNSYTMKELLEKEIVKIQDVTEIKNDILNLDKNTKVYSREIRVKNINNVEFWSFLECVIIRDFNRRPIKLLVKVTNIEHFKNEIKNLEKLNSIDPLTNLYNKKTIETLVNLRIDKENTSKFALCIIDIDYFKNINDSFGHVYGDGVLKEIAYELRSVATKKDYLGRIGGDEFVALFNNDDGSALEKIKKINEKMQKKYTIEDVTLGISASIGVAFFPENGNFYKDILEKADTALYNVKIEGKNNNKIYSDNLLSMDSIAKKNNILSRRDVNKNKDILDIITFFLETGNNRIAIQVTIEMICELYNINRACIFSRRARKFEKAYEYFNSQTIFSNENAEPDTSMPNYSRFKISNFLEIYRGEKFLHTIHYDRIERDFKSIDFEKAENVEITDFFTYYYNYNADVLGYFTFEKHDGSMFTKAQEAELAVICKLLENTITELYTAEKIRYEKDIYKLMIKKKDVSIHVLKKNTYEILYFNEFFKKLCPTVQIGSVCYELMNYDQPCKYCYAHKSYVRQDGYFGDKENSWIIQCTESNWEDDVDAIVVCARQAEDEFDEYELLLLDMLTKSPTLDKLKMDYEEIDNKSLYCMISLNIDRFKNINNAYGRQIGDEIIRKVAYTIKNFINLDEYFCRANDDKFIIILKYKDDENLTEKIKYLNKSFEEMQKISFSEINIVITAGVYKLLTDTDIISALDKANVARRQIKSSTNNKFRFYDDELNEKEEREIFIEKCLAKSVKKEEFIPFIQPKFDIITGEIIGAEALMRWEFEDKMLFPDEFIPTFERNGFIVILDFICYEKIMQYIKYCIDEGLKLVPISLNVSREHIKHGNFYNKFSTLIKNMKFHLI